MPAKANKVKQTVNKKKRRQVQATAVANKRLPAPVIKASKTKGKKRQELVAHLTGAAKASGAAAAEVPEKLKARQAAEFKEMKAKVAKLKKERKKLPKKGSKSEKVAVAQQIKELIHSTQVRHQAELAAAGLDVAAAPGAGEASMMSDDDV
mmetsp:Transcript_1457/g.3677  ORF Transcript_1457/g.3677 Transcript_1457/m.3677 type:complete len:151 (+) Transcript_1457:64-516(+)